MARIEKDSIGSINIDESAYWGTQTERSLRFFAIGKEAMPLEIMRALILIKRTAALVNDGLGLLSHDVCTAIVHACDEVLLHHRYTDQFPLRVWQTGSGTQSNMNVNEVIANIANVALGGSLGSKSPVHPNDHVNMGQSSNDCFPTALHMAVVFETIHTLLPELGLLGASFAKKEKEFKDFIKIGRTHLQDATPMTVGQEFSAFRAQISLNIHRIEESLRGLYALAQGGTAVGTGLNTHKDFAERFAQELAKTTKIPFVSAENKFEALATHDALVHFSAALNTLAVSCMKIGNDIRLLASGPRAGLNELHLPENEPGSSIMPGKVNPTQSEALTMVAAQVMGNHMTVTVAGGHGHLQLNVFKPVIGYNVLQSINLLASACASFRTHCLEGITVNEAQLLYNCEHTLMLATALNPLIGYDKASEVAKKAHLEGISLKQASLNLGVIKEDIFDEHVNPSKMLRPFGE